MATNPEPKTNISPSLKRMLLGHQALPSLSTIQGQILEESRTELSFPANVTTYNKMSLETNIASAISLFETMISRVNWKVVAPDSAPEEEKKRADLLNRNLYELERPWEEYVNEMLSILTYGFCPLEKIYQKNLKINGSTFIGWKHFPTISHASIKSWFFDDKTGALKGLLQDITNLRDRNPKSHKSKGDGLTYNQEELGKHKFLLFRHNPKRDNPEGNSPLKSCYITWKYLSIIEEFEVIGVTKDLGGVVRFDIPQEILAKAEEDPTSWEGKFVADLEKRAAAITAGDQAFIIMPRVYDDNGKPLYDFALQGIDGGGRQYNTNDIVTRHSNKLLLAFFATALKLGSDGVGSNALYDGQSNLITIGVEAILKNIQRTLNHDLIRQTYELNGWEWNPFTSARFKFGELEEQDMNVLSSFIQRTVAVGALRPTSDVEDYLRSFMKLAPMKEANPEILETENDSRSGDGAKTAGEGTSKGVDKRDNSVANKENTTASAVLLENDNGLCTVAVKGRTLKVMEEDLGIFDLEINK